MTLTDLAARIEAALAADYARRSTKARPLWGADAFPEHGHVAVRRVIGWTAGGGIPVHDWASLAPLDAQGFLAMLEAGGSANDWRW